jgi:D-beta-D-heptose 7-phosphate kinase/D-beta-D-heptose 1-phosphate adenosyltransferase
MNSTKNFKFAKEPELDPPWVRIEDLVKLKLKRPLVLINGTFDLLHSGHMKLFYHAQKKGKTIIVAMDSDVMVASKKPGRPIQTWIERATAFRFLPVDYLVEINNDDEFINLVRTIRPDLRIRGSEYRSGQSRCPEVPSLYVHNAGQRTSDIIERIKSRG